MNEDARAILEMFFLEFNGELERLECGARVQADHDDEVMMIVDLDGNEIGRTIRDTEPAAFASMMLVVERAFADGVRWGRENPYAEATPSITVQ